MSSGYITEATLKTKIASEGETYRLYKFAVLDYLPFVFDLVRGHPCFYLISQSLGRQMALIINHIIIFKKTLLIKSEDKRQCVP